MNTAGVRTLHTSYRSLSRGPWQDRLAQLLKRTRCDKGSDCASKRTTGREFTSPLHRGGHPLRIDHPSSISKSSDDPPDRIGGGNAPSGGDRGASPKLSIRCTTWRGAVSDMAGSGRLSVLATVVCQADSTWRLTSTSVCDLELEAWALLKGENMSGRSSVKIRCVCSFATGARLRECRPLESTEARGSIGIGTSKSPLKLEGCTLKLGGGEASGILPRICEPRAVARPPSRLDNEGPMPPPGG
mmetsp:Transcript_73008/g.237381  ORF Transcript_73008/g.237381 Transcript_73008/m.237381 type:complete len:244 (-) Transcript_73008:2799-3530(-)